MFSIWAKQQTIPSISASDSSKFQFYICFRPSQPDFLSVFHGNTVPPQEFRIDCKFQCQAAAKRALCSILSANRTTFAVWMPRRCKGFPSVAAWCFASSEMQYSFSVPNGPFIVFDITLWQVPFEQQGLSPFSSLLYILTVYRNLTYLIQYPAEQA